MTLQIKGIAESTGEASEKEVAVIVDSFGHLLPKLSNARFDAECGVHTKEAKILSMNMTNRSGLDESQFIFTLFGPFSERFSLKTKPLEIELWTKECLEEECLKVPKSTVLILRILDPASMVTSRQYHIVIRFTNVNSFGPRFKKDMYFMNVMEGSLIMEEVVRVEASDPDSDRLVYSLQDHSSLFGIDPYSGLLSIQHPEWLTPDSLGEFFNISVVVSDGKNKPDAATVVVHLMRKSNDDNTESVEFEKLEYEFTLEPGTFYVGQLNARSTSKAVYRISEGDAGVFVIDRHNGTLFYSGDLHEQTRNYSLKVTATSLDKNPRVDMCSAHVIVTGIGSVPAKFSSHLVQRVELDQAAPMNSVVYKGKAVDPDSGAVLRFGVSNIEVYDILGNKIPDSSVLAEYFAFANEGIQDGSLMLLQPIFDVNLMVFHLTLSVTDSAHSLEGYDYQHLIIRIVPVEMTMKPEQRISPSRIPTEIVIPNTLPVGSFVYMFTVNQAPALLRNDHFVAFTLVNDRRFFAMNKTTGIITTVADLHGLEATNLTVTATHARSQTSSTTFIPVKVLSVLNSPPLFEEAFYKLSVPENNDEIGFGPSTTTSLSTASSTAQIAKILSLCPISSVDREQIPEITFFLVATDSSGGVASASVKIEILDENDSEPAFRQESVTVSLLENSPIGTYVAKLEAYDPDSDKLSYSLMMNGLSDQLTVALHVDSLGRIMTTQALLGLDGKYQFGGIARDGKHSASIPISLTISATSRCHPTFSVNQSFVFFIRENNKKFDVIGRMEAHTANQCETAYSFWNSKTEEYQNSTELFSIDSRTGEISVIEVLDAEESDRYMLTVSANSGGLFILKTVEVRVEDTNDNIPLFLEKDVSVEVFENEAVGKVLARLRANDPDQSDTVYYHLRDSCDRRFAVDGKTGVLRLQKELDREDTDLFVLHVVASNSPIFKNVEPFDEAVVTVYVADINDNGPLFSQQVYSALIDRSSEAGRYLTTVFARDPDSASDQNVVSYYIDSVMFNYRGHVRPVQGIFNINERTGEITLGQSVKDFIGGGVEINLISADSVDKNANLGHATVKVWVYDESELVAFTLEQSVLSSDSALLEDISKSLEETISCKVMVESLRYAHSSGEIVRDASELHCLVLNETTQEIIPSEKAITLIEKKSLAAKNSKLAKLNLHTNGTPQVEVYKLPSYVSLLLVLVSVFAFLIVVILVVFGLVLCHYRTSFIHAKRRIEEEKIATGRANKAHRYKQPPPILAQSVSSLRELGLMASRKSTYAVQEIKMSVGSEEHRQKQDL
ncbi:hypothetical protein L596_002846 [Steinernema carpocapsae]|uniref:Cadherin domain-containing protein n=2 Tax=Steinernema carpocapsae TaxID=34508 RepID=A0A4U8UQV7_STECR|nr:hypothetical protein L596_002846 [Steinernema carpocapsae]